MSNCRCSDKVLFIKIFSQEAEFLAMLGVVGGAIRLQQGELYRR